MNKVHKYSNNVRGIPIMSHQMGDSKQLPHRIHRY